MNCPTCQTPAQSGAAFCDNCGSPLAAAPAPTPTSAPPPAAPAPPPAAPAASSSTGNSTCPQCSAEVLPGEAFCGNCGASLPQTGNQQPDQPPPPPGNTVTCKQCNTVLQAGSAFCDNCGAAITNSLPVPPIVESDLEGDIVIDPPLPPTQWPAPRLVVDNTQLDLPVGKNELIIGREDPVSGHFPDINLGPFAGEEKGVSRSHAKLMIQGNQCFLEDLQSVNFTHVNRSRLNPGTQQPLNDGDELRFGKVIVMFHTQ